MKPLGLREWMEEKRRILEKQRDEMAQAKGFEGHSDYARMKALKKMGVAYCVMCRRNVRPVPPWGFTRIVSLSLLTPGPWECPFCKGVEFAEAIRK